MAKIKRTVYLEDNLILAIEDYQRENKINSFNDAMNNYIKDLIKYGEEKSILGDIHELQKDTRKSITVIATILQNKLK